MRIVLAAGFLTTCLAGAVQAQDARINYREDRLRCTFVKMCDADHPMRIVGRKIDETQCLDVNDVLTWDPKAQRLAFRDKPQPVQYVDERRGWVSVGFMIGTDHVNFAAGDQRPTLRFRKSPEGPSPIIRMMGGTCAAAP